MRYVRVVDGVITAAPGALPEQSTRFDTGEVVLGLPGQSSEIQEACGWFPWSEPDSGDDLPALRAEMRDKAAVMFARLDRIADYNPPPITTNLIAQAELAKTMTAVQDIATYLKAVVRWLLAPDR